MRGERGFNYSAITTRLTGCTTGLATRVRFCAGSLLYPASKWDVVVDGHTTGGWGTGRLPAAPFVRICAPIAGGKREKETAGK